MISFNTCGVGTVNIFIKKGSAFRNMNEGVNSLSCVRLFVTPWTEEPGRLQSTEFPRQEYWSGLPFPPPGNLPGPGTEPRSPALQADTLPSKPPGKYE